MHEWHTSFLKVMQPLPKGTKTPEQLVAGDDMYLKFLMVGTNVKIVVSFAKTIVTFNLRFLLSLCGHCCPQGIPID
jgi:hypothetical protein